MRSYTLHFISDGAATLETKKSKAAEIKHARRRADQTRERSRKAEAVQTKNEFCDPIKKEKTELTDT